MEQEKAESLEKRLLAFESEEKERGWKTIEENISLAATVSTSTYNSVRTVLSLLYCVNCVDMI